MSSEISSHDWWAARIVTAFVSSLVGLLVGSGGGWLVLNSRVTAVEVHMIDTHERVVRIEGLLIEDLKHHVPKQLVLTHQASSCECGPDCPGAACKCGCK